LGAERPAEPPPFEDVLKVYEHDLRGFISRRVRDPDLANDVVQDTLIRAYHARAVFDRERPVWPWLATIARNTMSNAIRDERRRVALVDTGCDWTDIAATADIRPDVDPETTLLGTLRRSAIAVALSSLAARQRRLLLLRARDGMSYEEIAVAERLSVDAVKSLLKRARCAFRSAYEQESSGRPTAAARNQAVDEAPHCQPTTAGSPPPESQARACASRSDVRRSAT
jgi:RNA polymerase sigma-70 factor (ECF subfamily)